MVRRAIEQSRKVQLQCQAMGLLQDRYEKVFSPFRKIIYLFINYSLMPSQKGGCTPPQLLRMVVVEALSYLE